MEDELRKRIADLEIANAKLCDQINQLQGEYDILEETESISAKVAVRSLVRCARLEKLVELMFPHVMHSDISAGEFAEIGFEMKKLQVDLNG